MRNSIVVLSFFVALAILNVNATPLVSTLQEAHLASEIHLANVKQLTFGGENA